MALSSHGSSQPLVLYRNPAVMLAEKCSRLHRSLFIGLLIFKRQLGRSNFTIDTPRLVQRLVACHILSEKFLPPVRRLQVIWHRESWSPVLEAISQHSRVGFVLIQVATSEGDRRVALI